MKKILGVAALLVVTAGVVAFTSASAYGAATVIVSDGCFVVDANGVHSFDAGCRIQLVQNKNGYLVNAHGQLPAGAALPDSALRRDITDLGFSACYLPGDRGETETTPSGNFNVSCHAAK